MPEYTTLPFPTFYTGTGKYKMSDYVKTLLSQLLSQVKKKIDQKVYGQIMSEYMPQQDTTCK